MEDQLKEWTKTNSKNFNKGIVKPAENQIIDVNTNVVNNNKSEQSNKDKIVEKIPDKNNETNKKITFDLKK